MPLFSNTHRNEFYGPLNNVLRNSVTVFVCSNSRAQTSNIHKMLKKSNPSNWTNDKSASLLTYGNDFFLIQIILYLLNILIINQFHNKKTIQTGLSSLKVTVTR